MWKMTRLTANACVTCVENELRLARADGSRKQDILTTMPIPLSLARGWFCFLDASVRSWGAWGSV